MSRTILSLMRLSVAPEFKREGTIERAPGMCTGRCTSFDEKRVSEVVVCASLRPLTSQGSETDIFPLGLSDEG